MYYLGALEKKDKYIPYLLIICKILKMLLPSERGCLLQREDIKKQFLLHNLRDLLWTIVY